MLKVKTPLTDQHLMKALEGSKNKQYFKTAEMVIRKDNKHSNKPSTISDRDIIQEHFLES